MVFCRGMNVVRLLAILLLVTAGPAAHALGFDDALLSASRTPRILGARAALETRNRLDADLPRQTGNPEVTVAPGLSLGSDRATGGPGLALQVGVQQSWNLANLAQARRRAAADERAALAVLLRADALEQKLGAAQAWLELWAAQSLVQATLRERQLAIELAKVVAAAAQRGVLTQADVAEADLFVSEVDLRLVGLEGDTHDRSVALARSLSLPAASLPEATGALPQPVLPDAVAWHALILQAARLPDAVAKRLHVQAERARVLELAAQHGSMVSLGAAVQRDGQGTTAILATFGLRWGLFERGQRLASQAQETVVRADAESIHADIDAGHRLAAAWHEVEHGREREQVLRDRVVASAERLVVLRDRQFARGVGTVFDVLRARQARLEAERRRIEATAVRTWAELKAWLLYAELARAPAEEGP